MRAKTKEPGKHVGTKAVAAKVLLASGETIRSTAEALGIGKNTALSISHEQILSEAQLNQLDRIIRETALKKTKLAIDKITEEKLDKSRASELAGIARELKKIAEGEKESTATLCNTLILAKYAVKEPQHIDMSPHATTYEEENPLEINKGIG